MTTLALLFLLAQAGQAAAATTATTTTAVAQDDYKIGPADVLNVTVFGESDASRAGATVDNDGTIDMPYIGRVKVAGQTLRGVEKEIRDRLAAKYLLNPSVSVEIVKYRSKIVSVVGQVNNPGEYPLEGNVSVTSALARAGSLSMSAGSYVVISRRTASGTPEQIKVPRRDIESGAAQSVLLKDGDVVLVPKAETILVTGQVRTPGSYAWDEGLTVERALILAGGMTDRASAGKISIERDGKVVNKKAKKTDLVQANDTIRVPTRIF
jgi:polysaccharide export outer membrane protein